jgi:hypothetical protein
MKYVDCRGRKGDLVVWPFKRKPKRERYTIIGEQAQQILNEIKQPTTERQKQTMIHALQNRMPRMEV